MVAKKLVVVAWLPVAFTKVRFWRVEDPVARKFAPVMRAEEVKLPPFPVVKNRLVVEAVVENRLVVVAFVIVAYAAERLVVEAVVAKKLVEVPEVVVDLVMELKMLFPVKVLLSERRVEEEVLSATQEKEPPVHCRWKAPVHEVSAPA